MAHIPPENVDAPPANGVLDTAIIGAGPGGLYSAWRLSHNGQPSLAVFDGLGRHGGRVDSLEGLGFTADIGAMRFLPTHVLLEGLLATFNLKDFEHNVPVLLYHFRGRDILPKLDDDLIKVDSPYRTHRERDRPDLMEFTHEVSPRKQDAYKLKPDEESISPDALLRFAIGRVLSAIELPDDENVSGTDTSVIDVRDKLRRAGTNWKTLCFQLFTVAEWRLIKEFGSYKGTKLYNLSLWEIVSRDRILSAEAFALARDCMGYHTIFGPWNAAEHIPWFLAEFGPEPYRSVVGGMAGLTNSLRTGIDTKLGNKDWLVLLHTLVAIEGSDSCYRLEFQVAQKDDEGRIMLTTAYRWAKRVILSVSAGALRGIGFYDRVWKPSDGANFSSDVSPTAVGTSPPTDLLDRRKRMTISKSLSTETHAETFQEALECLTSNTLMKAFALYEKPWFWESISEKSKERLHAGRRVILDKDGSFDAEGEWIVPHGAKFVAARIQTNLPVRQLYLFGPGIREKNGRWWNADAGDNRPCGLIMAYCDATESEYWATLARKRNQGPFYAKHWYREKFLSKMQINTLTPYAIGPQFYDTFQALIGRVARAMRQDGAHNKADNDEDATLPDPVAMVFQNWSEPPFHGGWHAWKMTYKPWRIRPLIRRPFDGQDIFICGEAISADQGWIEGALKTAEAVMRNEIELPIPSFVSVKAIESAGYCKSSDSVEQALTSYLAW